VVILESHDDFAACLVKLDSVVEDVVQNLLKDLQVGDHLERHLRQDHYLISELVTLHWDVERLSHVLNIGLQTSATHGHVVQLKSCVLHLQLTDLRLNLVFEKLGRAPNNLHVLARFFLVQLHLAIFLSSQSLGQIDNRVERRELFVRHGLDHELLVLEFGLGLLLPHDIAHVSDNNELAVVVVKAPGLDLNFEHHLLVSVIFIILLDLLCGSLLILSPTQVVEAFAHPALNQHLGQRLALVNNCVKGRIRRLDKLFVGLRSLEDVGLEKFLIQGLFDAKLLDVEDLTQLVVDEANIWH
jgi:hypothetical protein